MKRLFPFFICLNLILGFTPITAAAAGLLSGQYHQNPHSADRTGGM